MQTVGNFIDSSTTRENKEGGRRVSGNIMIVDDNLFNIVVAENFVKTTGFGSISALNGK